MKRIINHIAVVLLVLALIHLNAADKEELNPTPPVVSHQMSQLSESVSNKMIRNSFEHLKPCFNFCKELCFCCARTILSLNDLDRLCEEVEAMEQDEPYFGERLEAMRQHED